MTAQKVWRAMQIAFLAVVFVAANVIVQIPDRHERLCYVAPLLVICLVMIAANVYQAKRRKAS